MTPSIVTALAVLVCAPLVAIVYALSKARRPRHRHHPLTRMATGEIDLPASWVHAFDDERCTGCEACVEACPTDVLTVVDYQVRLAVPQACVECRQCEQACTTGALVMHRAGKAPPEVSMPVVDLNLESSVPGQYVIGDAAGIPHIKNAANTGRMVVEHMIITGLKATPGTGATQGDPIDVAIVGSGPGGLSAALTCAHHGLGCVVLERDVLLAAAVARCPKDTVLESTPKEVRNLSFLPVFDALKDQLLLAWQTVVRRARLRVRLNHPVERVRRVDDELFEVVSSKCTVYARRVVLAVGARTRTETIGVPESSRITVANELGDPGAYREQHVLVVGSSDDALEAACALCDAGARVVLSHRGRAFSRASRANRAALDVREDLGTLRVLLQSKLRKVEQSSVVLELASGRTTELAVNQILIIGDAPKYWLQQQGVKLRKQPYALHIPATDLRVAALTDAVECPDDPDDAIALVAPQVHSIPVGKPSTKRQRARGTPIHWDAEPTVEYPSRDALAALWLASQSERHPGFHEVGDVDSNTG